MFGNINLHFRIGWLSLVILFFFEIIISSIFNFKLDGNILILFTIIILPLVNIGIQEIKKDFFSLSTKFEGINILKFIFLIIIGVLFYFNVESYNLFDFFTFLYFIFAILFLFESKIAFFIALILLSYCPILLIINNNNAAESFAVYTYYFLCIGVITQILELKFGNENYKSTIFNKLNLIIPGNIIQNFFLPFDQILKLYFKELSGYFSISNFILTILMFLGIFLFYIFNINLGELNGLLMILLAGFIFNSIYKTEKIELIKKGNFESFHYMFMFLISGLLFIFINKFLFINYVNFYNLYINLFILVLFNFLVIYYNSNLINLKK